MAERRGCQIGFRRYEKAERLRRRQIRTDAERTGTARKKGFKGIYNGDEQAIADAKKALECKRAILLANPLLDPTRSWQPVSR